MSSFRPALVLAAIAAIVSALVIITYNITYVDTSAILTDKQAAAAVAVYGGAEEDYSVMPVADWQPILHADENSDLCRVKKIISHKDGSLAFEVVVKGYKEGYDILVGVKDGAVAGLSVISTGEETPNLGTKTADPTYLESFIGADGTVTIVRSAPKSDNEIQAVTGATYSSKGVASAVNIALEAYKTLNEARTLAVLPENAEDTHLGGDTE